MSYSFHLSKNAAAGDDEAAKKNSSDRSIDWLLSHVPSTQTAASILRRRDLEEANDRMHRCLLGMREYWLSLRLLMRRHQTAPTSLLEAIDAELGLLAELIDQQHCRDGLPENP